MAVYMIVEPQELESETGMQQFHCAAVGLTSDDRTRDPARFPHGGPFSCSDTGSGDSPPMNLQHWIDQHPAVFAAIFPIYFLCLWFLVAATVSIVGGWFSLARVYRTRVPFNGAKWRMQSGQMRWLANYNSVLTLGVSPHGLYLASMFLFRFMHPPLLVPGSEIKVRRNKGWVFEYVIFTMGHELAIPLRIRGKLGAKLRESAGNCWPVEET